MRSMDDSTTARPRVSTSVARSFTRARSSPRRSSRRRVASRRVAHCGRSHFFPIHRHTVTRRVAASLRDRRAARRARDDDDVLRRRALERELAEKRARERDGTPGRRAVGTTTRGRGRTPLSSPRDVARARERRACATRAVEREDDGVDWSREMTEAGEDGEFVVEAFDTSDELVRALCLEVEENARGCLEERGAFTMAIPGGSVAKALKGLAEAKDLDWEKVHVFFVNERPGEQKCAKLAVETWTEACGIPEANVHRVMETGDMELAAAEYERQMRTLDESQLPIDEENGMPVFDLILLGMGADGHVGSIYPNSPAANDESGACVLGVNMPSKVSVTMSMPLINTADRVVLAATGSEKAEIVRASLEDELEWGEIPGSMVDAFSTIWFLDLAAASLLSAYEDIDIDGDED